jgi:hypothetical protein
LEAVSRIVLRNLHLKKLDKGKPMWKNLTTFTTEEERLDAIEKEFGIKLSQEERSYKIVNGKLMSKV